MMILGIICCITAVVTSSFGIPVNDAFVTVSSETFTTSSPDKTIEFHNGKTSDGIQKPELYSMKVYSEINTRYATNVISSYVANPANKSQEVTFSIVIPETAFISEFLMEFDGKVYKAYVKKKEEAKQIYDHAVNSGIGAAHVSISARDSNRFRVSVNIEPSSKALFNLTYEELLTRRLGVYNLVINLHPGQLVREMSVDVNIVESQRITDLRTPTLRSGNEIDPDENTENNAYATKKFTNDAKTMAHIRFSPTIDQQKELINQLKIKQDEKLTDNINSGVSGQFVVQYDVERDLSGGTVVVYDGYFVHFFAPSDLTPLNKHVIFVLDVSGSMSGSKIAQLKRAMNYILDDLHPGDYFNIIEFSYSAYIYDLNNITKPKVVDFPWFSDERKESEPIELIPAFAANKVNIAKAKEIIDQLDAVGGTNIDEALKVALRVATAGVNKNDDSNSGPEPLIMFLTDGDPTVGETKTSTILKTVSELNTGLRYSSIFTLAFGNYADRGFLKQLSIRNSGFMRHIYEANDADVQLQQFYKQISSPLLKNISFVYPDNQIENLTDNKCHILFAGSECVTAGKLIHKNIIPEPTILIQHKNDSSFIPKVVETSITPQSKPSLERLWAFLKIKQLLDQKDAYIDPNVGPTLYDGTTTESPKTETGVKSIEDQALEIALKYSFVTKLTSLVVVKPNSTTDTTAETLPVPSPIERDYPTMALALNVQSFHDVENDEIDRKDVMPGFSSDISYATTTYRSNNALLIKYGLENLQWLNIFDGYIQLQGVSYNITDLPKEKTSFGDCSNVGNGSAGLCVPVSRCIDSLTLLTNENDYDKYKCNGEYLGNVYFTMCCSNSSITTNA